MSPPVHAARYPPSTPRSPRPPRMASIVNARFFPAPPPPPPAGGKRGGKRSASRAAGTGKGGGGWRKAGWMRSAGRRGSATRPGSVAAGVACMSPVRRSAPSHVTPPRRSLCRLASNAEHRHYHTAATSQSARRSPPPGGYIARSRDVRRTAPTCCTLHQSSTIIDVTAEITTDKAVVISTWCYLLGFRAASSGRITSLRSSK